MNLSTESFGSDGQQDQDFFFVLQILHIFIAKSHGNGFDHLAAIEFFDLSLCKMN